MKLVNALASVPLVSAQDWWTTAAPESYQCALEFVPRDLLNRASQYTQVFLNALTKESPDYWGSYYGGASYTTKCHSSTIAEPTTTIRETSTAIFTIAQAPGPVVVSPEPTTTLTATQIVTRTRYPSSSSPQHLYKSTATVTITRPHSDATVTTTPRTIVGTPLASTSFSGSVYPDTDYPSVTTFTLTLFTRTPVLDTNVYTTHWANTTRPYPTRYTNATSARNPQYTNTTRPVVPPVTYASTPINYNKTRSSTSTATTTTTVHVVTESRQLPVNPTSFLTVTYTIVGGTTLGAPSSSAIEPTATLNNVLNTNLPTGGWNSAIGSNPFGSNPFGSNPFGSNPFGSNSIGTHESTTTSR